MPFEVALVDPSDVPIYITIAQKTLHLQELRMNVNQIAVALDVDRTTVVRALRWITGNSAYTKKLSQYT
jgi:predicted transcriptional regulator